MGAKGVNNSAHPPEGSPVKTGGLTALSLPLVPFFSITPAKKAGETHIYAHTHAHTHTHIYICIYVCVCVCVCAYVCLYIYIYIIRISEKVDKSNTTTSLVPLKVFDLSIFPLIFIILSDSPKSTISLSLYVCVHMCCRCVHVYICVYIYMHMCVYIRKYMCVCVWVFIYIYMCVLECACVRTRFTQKLMWIFV